MNDIEVDTVDKETKRVTFNTECGSLTIVNGKICSHIGFITPREKKLAIKKYYAIIKNN